MRGAGGTAGRRWRHGWAAAGRGRAAFHTGLEQREGGDYKKASKAHARLAAALNGFAGLQLVGHIGPFGGCRGVYTATQLLWPDGTVWERRVDGCAAPSGAGEAAAAATLPAGAGSRRRTAVHAEHDMRR